MATSVSILKTALELQVLELVEMVAAPLGFRPVEVDCRVGGSSLVRVFIERIQPNAEADNSASLAPTLDDCALVSRALGAALDLKMGIDSETGELINRGENAGTEIRWFPGPYTLEVSSPGLDRRLRIQPDFEQVVGENVRLKLSENVLGTGINVVGMLTRIDGDTLHMRVPGAKPEEFEVRLGQIRHANVVWRREE